MSLSMQKYDQESLHSQQSLIETELGEWSQSQPLNSSDTTLDMTYSLQPSLVLPTLYMEIDQQIGIIHLLMIYAEAMGNKLEELALVLQSSEKVSPVSDNILTRLLYYLFLYLDKHSATYLKHEPLKIFYSALKAIYQILPNGRVAHFVDNKAILDAMPDEDLGNEQREVRLTSIRPIEDMIDNLCTRHTRWSFEDAKRRLLDHARLYGIKLKVEEKELNDLVTEEEYKETER
ncbi:hypothetical protein RND71_038509 [Anisodus tanguticus]|uniref:Uncharacterized protein n=1 Tax=Anisodus tanguticus TaxID=243964 RepID=A0AAE1R0M5_9SOLA|nr:hypothetical protein RND71_038509 [Anisodus tanguticus]